MSNQRRVRPPGTEPVVPPRHIRPDPPGRSEVVGEKGTSLVLGNSSDESGRVTKRNLEGALYQRRHVVRPRIYPRPPVRERREPDPATGVPRVGRQHPGGDRTQVEPSFGGRVAKVLRVKPGHGLLRLEAAHVHHLRAVYVDIADELEQPDRPNLLRLVAALYLARGNLLLALRSLLFRRRRSVDVVEALFVLRCETPPNPLQKLTRAVHGM